ncbi:MAG: hypothetical protein WBG02_02895 [Candidatus Acidiferrum sp.]
MIMGIGHSLAFHIDGTGQDQTENVGSREGIWWLPSSTANDYLVVTNQGQNALQANLSVFDAAGKPSAQIITLAPRAMARYSIRQIAASAGLAGSYGGIKVSAASHAGSLDTLHVVFDPSGGFSAVMKMFDYDPRAQLKERDYAGTGVWTLRAPMLALSNPDPALAFPVGTTLHPQLFIHNNIARIAKLNLSFHWHSDSADGQVPATVLQLAPFQTQQIDIGSMQSCKVIPADAHWASVTLSTDGLPDEVVAVAASYDQSLRYGAQTPFSDQLALQWEGGQWQYDPQHDSIITFGNGGAKPTQAAFTIFYNQGTQKYELDQTLQPGQQMWMDIGKLIRENAPDKDGNTLPADLTTGSYNIRDLTDKTTAMLFEGKVIYDKTYGHVTYGCAACCGYFIPILWYDPINIFYQGLEDDGVQAWYPCENEYDDVSSPFYNDWSSDSPSIVTVDSRGTHTGVSTGSTTTQTFGNLMSNDAKNLCPALHRTPSGGANVTPEITSISPSEGLIGNTVSVSIAGKGFGSSPSIVAPSGITPAIQSSSDTQISATLAISTSVAGGNQPIQVTNTQSSTTSSAVNFYVQIPQTLVRSPDYGTNGLGPVNVLTNGSVINIYGDTELTNQCGVYEVIGYQLVDQRSPAQYIYGNYDLEEQFSNFSSTVVGQTAPPTQDNPIVISQTILGDTQYYGKTAPSCPGPNDNEQFTQSLSVIIGGKSYPLTMVNTIQMGFYSGTGNVTVTINTP